MDQEVPTPGSQIPELSCIVPQVPSVPFQTLGCRTETLYNLIPTKFMGDSHWDLVWFLHCLPRPHHPFSQHGFKRKIWLLLLFRQETWDRNDWCSRGGPFMSSPGITGGACDPFYLRSAFPKGRGLAESDGILSIEWNGRRISLCNIWKQDWVLNKSKPSTVCCTDTGNFCGKGEYRVAVLISMAHCGLFGFCFCSFFVDF